MKINREEFLKQLEAVFPGVAKREVLEQSSCFVIEDGTITTFNDEVACTIATTLDITGAVAAAPLMAILGKLLEDEVDVTSDGKELQINGKRKKTHITLEAKITLPRDKIEKPTKWKVLDPEFCNALSIVIQCASDNDGSFPLCCVHFTDKFIEATDNYQLTRYRIETGLPEDCDIIIKKQSIRAVGTLGMTEMCKTKHWLHFKNPSGLILSVRLDKAEYHDLDIPLQMENGVPTTLPGGLAEAVARAEVFSAETTENNLIRIDLVPGKLRLRGTGKSGRHEELKTVNYDGDAISFMISPKILVEITKKHNDCLITPGKLKVDGGKFTYISCLVDPEAING